MLQGVTFIKGEDYVGTFKEEQMKKKLIVYYEKEIDALKSIKNKIDNSCEGGFCDNCLNFQLCKKKNVRLEF